MPTLVLLYHIYVMGGDRGTASHSVTVRDRRRVSHAKLQSSAASLWLPSGSPTAPRIAACQSTALIISLKIVKSPVVVTGTGTGDRSSLGTMGAGSSVQQLGRHTISVFVDTRDAGQHHALRFLPQHSVTVGAGKGCAGDIGVHIEEVADDASSTSRSTSSASGECGLEQGGTAPCVHPSVPLPCDPDVRLLGVALDAAQTQPIGVARRVVTLQVADSSGSSAIVAGAASKAEQKPVPLSSIPVDEGSLVGDNDGVGVYDPATTWLSTASEAEDEDDAVPGASNDCGSAEAVAAVKQMVFAANAPVQHAPDTGGASRARSASTAAFGGTGYESRTSDESEDSDEEDRDDRIRELVEGYRRFAELGMSQRADRNARRVVRLLQRGPAGLATVRLLFACASEHEAFGQVVLSAGALGVDSNVANDNSDRAVGKAAGVRSRQGRVRCRRRRRKGQGAHAPSQSGAPVSRHAPQPESRPLRPLITPAAHPVQASPPAVSIAAASPVDSAMTRSRRNPTENRGADSHGSRDVPRPHNPDGAAALMPCQCMGSHGVPTHAHIVISAAPAPSVPNGNRAGESPGHLAVLTSLLLEERGRVREERAAERSAAEAAANAFSMERESWQRERDSLQSQVRDGEAALQRARQEQATLQSLMDEQAAAAITEESRLRSVVDELMERQRRMRRHAHELKKQVARLRGKASGPGAATPTGGASKTSAEGGPTTRLPADGVATSPPRTQRLSVHVAGAGGPSLVRKAVDVSCQTPEFGAADADAAANGDCDKCIEMRRYFIATLRQVRQILTGTTAAPVRSAASSTPVGPRSADISRPAAVFHSSASPTEPA